MAAYLFWFSKLKFAFLVSQLKKNYSSFFCSKKPSQSVLPKYKKCIRRDYVHEWCMQLGASLPLWSMETMWFHKLLNYNKLVTRASIKNILYPFYGGSKTSYTPTIMFLFVQVFKICSKRRSTQSWSRNSQGRITSTSCELEDHLDKLNFVLLNSVTSMSN